MSQVINTNVLSLTAQRNLSNSQSQLATSLQRLSSGLRINSAKDDAAGLAISERFSTQIRGLNQAIRNANDGVSLSQTAEAALNEVTNNLQRIRELAVQSANATNSNSDRATLDQEVQQRLAEINRIANQTSFNGRNILDGSFGNAAFQVGANVGQTIDLALTASVRGDQIGKVAVVQSPSFESLSGGPSRLDLGAWQNSSLGLTSGSLLRMTFDAGSDNVLVVDATVPDGLSSIISIDVADAFVTAGFNSTTGAGTPQGFELDLGGISGIATAAILGSLSVTREDGASFTYEQEFIGGTSGFFAFVEPGFPDAPADATLASLTINNDFSIQIGDADAVNVANGTYETAQELADALNEALAGAGFASVNDAGGLSIAAGDTITIGGDTGLNVFQFDEVTQVDRALSAANVRTAVAANEAILSIDAALTEVADLRSQLGAIQNRFESTIANLTTTSENLSASRSRIRDADFAVETAELTRLQILQQAGISVLAQANVSPQSVLALLQ